MICDTPENFEQCRLQKTILQHFPYNLNMHSRWIALIQDGGKTKTVLIEFNSMLPPTFYFERGIRHCSMLCVGLF